MANYLYGIRADTFISGSQFMTRFFMILAPMGLASLSAQAAVAQNVATTAGAASANSEPEKKFCKQIVPTGSIMAKRFCFTKKDWKEFDERTRAGAESFLARRTAGSPVED